MFIPYLGWNHQLEIMFRIFFTLETWIRVVFVGVFAIGLDGCKWGLTTLNGWIHLGESLTTLREELSSPNFLSNEQKAKSPINWMFLNNDTASKHSLLCGLFWDPKSKYLTNHLENSFMLIKSSETFVVFNVCFVHVEISYHMTINRKHVYQSLCFLCDFLQKLHVAPLLFCLALCEIHPWKLTNVPWKVTISKRTISSSNHHFSGPNELLIFVGVNLLISHGGVIPLLFWSDRFDVKISKFDLKNATL